ncbi:MAG: YjjG family noncanonical pyrimidine nucleotidase [Salinivirgaceae bacterium]|nr:YjjG family noncanonical pyrimidine nucleotidase [Salinivirgaceae bacterium]
MQIKTQKKYKNLFFDLDRTLWDFQTNSEQTLCELIDKYLAKEKIEFDVFLKIYYSINEDLWLKYRKGEITKEYLRTMRFSKTFSKLGIRMSEEICINISDDYIKESPLKTGVFQGTYETLDYLKGKGYRLFLITNGFIEVQVKKIKQSKLEPYFERMFTSDEAGYQKPDKRIFEHALKTSNSKKSESIMIGDDLETDIAGANSFGMDSVFFNPEGDAHTSKVTYEIAKLENLKQFL